MPIALLQGATAAAKGRVIDNRRVRQQAADVAS